MQWSDIKKTYPNQWLVVEALDAYTSDNKTRHINNLAVVELCSDSLSALKTYRHLHQQHPDKEYYYIHTSRSELKVHERQWVGIRNINEHTPSR